MKRDMDLVRDILLAVEEHDDDRFRPLELDIPDRPQPEVSYHVMLLADAGLIDAADLSSPNRLDWRPRRLTWAGHEFLEVARNNSIWSRAKQRVTQSTDGLAFDLLKSVLLALAKESLGGH